MVESKCDTLLYQHAPKGGGFVFWGARNTFIKDRASVTIPLPPLHALHIPSRPYPTPRLAAGSRHDDASFAPQ